MVHFHHKHALAFLHFKQELNAFFVASTLHFFALGLISVFVPVFLLEIGYSLHEIFAFLLVAIATYLALIPFAAKFIGKVGMHKSILLSKPFIIVALSLLYFLEANPSLFYPSAVLHGIFWSLFWMSYLIDLAKIIDQKKEGSELGIEHVLKNSATFIAPITGAGIIAFFGFPALFLIASILLLVSAVPLLFAKQHIHVVNFQVHNLIHCNKRDLLGYIGRGFIGEPSETVWILFMFAILGNYYLLGTVSAVSFFISAITIVFFGFLLDKYNHHAVEKVSVVADFLSWIVRALSITVTHVFGFAILSRIAANASQLSIDALTYDKTRKITAVEEIAIRETGIKIGSILFILIFLFVLQADLTAGLLLAGVGSLFSLLL